MKALTLFVRRFAFAWPLSCAAGVTCAAVILLWFVRDTPLELGANMRVDALSAFFCAALLAGLSITFAGPGSPLAWRQIVRPIVVVGLLLLVCTTTLSLVIACGGLLLALLVRGPGAVGVPQMHRLSRAALPELARRALATAPWLLAATSLLVGYGALALRGAARYSDRGAGAALDSFVFWFVLLAAAISLAPFAAPATAASKQTTPFGARASTIVWLYPLLRLYSLGPWNTGWSLATLLLGGGLVGWCAVSAFAQPDRRASALRMRASYLGMALAGVGLGAGAGLAAACYALLAYLLLGAALPLPRGNWGGSPERAARADKVVALPPVSLVTWLLAGVFPFTVPFVALWMTIGASIAGGVPLLAGLVWLAGLLNGLTVALWGLPAEPSQGRAGWFVAALSVVLGISAPLVARELIEPVAAQLQGGLTPYGNLAIWPWVGLATNDAGNTQVTTLPSIALALLMLVLAALVYLAARLREIYVPAALPDPQAPSAGAPLELGDLLPSLREEVPWLQLLFGDRPAPKKAPRERE